MSTMRRIGTHEPAEHLLRLAADQIHLAEKAR